MDQPTIQNNNNNNNIPSVASVIKELARALQCAVCLAVVTRPVLLARCSHFFCYQCIREWMKTRGRTCPVCRTRMIEKLKAVLLGEGLELQPSPSLQQVVHLLHSLSISINQPLEPDSAEKVLRQHENLKASSEQQKCVPWAHNSSKDSTYAASTFTDSNESSEDDDDNNNNNDDDRDEDSHTCSGETGVYSADLDRDEGNRQPDDDEEKSDRIGLRRSQNSPSFTAHAKPSTAPSSSRPGKGAFIYLLFET